MKNVVAFYLFSAMNSRRLAVFMVGPWPEFNPTVIYT
jgi:hypothetical protein